MILRLAFAGIINRVDNKTIGGKLLSEISLCRKNYAKQGDPETYTWVRVGLWEPKDWQTEKLVKGAFIAGSGEFQLRSYEKDGEKRQSAEVRCNSFDVEVGEVAAPRGEAHEPAPVKPATRSTAAIVGALPLDEPPF